MWPIANPFELKEGVEYILDSGKVVTFKKTYGKQDGHDWRTVLPGGNWCFTKEGKAHSACDSSKKVLRHVVGIKKG